MIPKYHRSGGDFSRTATFGFQKCLHGSGFSSEPGFFSLLSFAVLESSIYLSRRVLQFMDPVSAIASIVGIVGFGIQIAQILQKEIDIIQTATERVEQIAKLRFGLQQRA